MARNSDPNFERLARILQRFVDDQQTEAELKELSSLLESSEDYCRYYLEYLDIDTLMKECWGSGFPTPSSDGVLHGAASTSGKGPHSPRFPGVSSGSFPFGFSQIATAIVAVLLAANCVLLYQSSQPNRGAASVAEENVPQLVGMTACVWHADAPKVGSSFGHGELVELLEGIAEFEVRNRLGERARVRIEGPASIFVRSDGQLGLRSGLLTARSTDSNGEFRIDIPNGAVAFSGDSSIGIEAQYSETQIHVFDGAAVLEKGFAVDIDGVLLRVKAGESASFVHVPEGKMSVTRSDADRDKFASTRSMSVDGLCLDDTYRDAVMSCRPTIYWRFDQGDVVRNEVSDRYHAYLRGSVHWKRDGENESTEFGLSTDGGAFATNELWPTRELDEYSVEMWVKPSHYHNGALFGLCVPDSFLHGLMLEIGAPYHKFDDERTRPNIFRFLHRSPPGKANGESCYGDCPYKVRKWQHVVARRKDSLLELFIDGELVGCKDSGEPMPPGFNVLIGQLYPHKLERSFIGQIDEVAVYEHALTEEQIRSHFKTAQRLPDKKHKADQGTL